ncbi:MAG: hypothetical protein MI725_14795 [Pirellulales bacterium]|nr:hypothetical protein [Pirellulales bacterium]
MWPAIRMALIGILLANFSLPLGAQTEEWSEPSRDLFLINVDGSELTPLCPDFTKSRLCGSPAWSPDGKWVAFDTWKIGQGLTDTHLFVVRADGTELRDLGPGAMPSWSPDGKQIVCHTYSPSHVVVLNVDGTDRETVVDHWGSPRWSPVHDRIFLMGRRGSIAVYDLKKGVEQSVLEDSYSPRLGFSISPNGNRICFGDNKGGVYIAQLDETTMLAKAKERVAKGKTTHSSWSPDGKQIVFSWRSTSMEPYQLYLVEADSEDPPKLLPGQNNWLHNTDPAWSPDGKKIVYAASASR